VQVSAPFHDPDAAQIARFLADIGIVVRAGEIRAQTFLPGILIDRGAIVIDEARLTYPGDLLHEAGHVALMPPADRATAGPDISEDGGFEMAATAWSYAAAIHLGLDLRILFHDGGYRGNSPAIIENFRAGRYFGVPVLEWLDMTVGPKKAMEMGVAPYPNMLRWLRP
jgi:hypothetical protein